MSDWLDDWTYWLATVWELATAIVGFVLALVIAAVLLGTPLVLAYFVWRLL